jgi:hypothetical protein
MGTFLAVVHHHRDADYWKSRVSYAVILGKCISNYRALSVAPRAVKSKAREINQTTMLSRNGKSSAEAVAG